MWVAVRGRPFARTHGSPGAAPHSAHLNVRAKSRETERLRRDGIIFGLMRTL
jgi:hypothetical protein